jgi:hypothetical protein
MSGQCTVSTNLRAQQYLERVSLECFLSKMTRKKNDGAVVRYYLSVILILSAMMVVRGAWTDSTMSTKTGFDYVSAVWSSSTTCVIVGNGATNGAIQLTTNSGYSWSDVTQTRQPYLLTNIAQIPSEGNSFYLVTGSNNVESASGGYVFTSTDGTTFSDAKLVSTNGLNGVAIGSNGSAYVVGLGGKIYNSVSGVDWSSWNDVTPASNIQVMQSRRYYSTLSMK